MQETAFQGQDHVLPDPKYPIYKYPKTDSLAIWTMGAGPQFPLDLFTFTHQSCLWTQKSSGRKRGLECREEQLKFGAHVAWYLSYLICVVKGVQKAQDKRLQSDLFSGNQLSPRHSRQNFLLAGVPSRKGFSPFKQRVNIQKGWKKKKKQASFLRSKEFTHNPEQLSRKPHCHLGSSCCLNQEYGLVSWTSVSWEPRGRVAMPGGESRFKTSGPQRHHHCPPAMKITSRL